MLIEDNDETNEMEFVTNEEEEKLTKKNEKSMKNKNEKNVKNEQLKNEEKIFRTIRTSISQNNLEMECPA